MSGPSVLGAPVFVQSVRDAASKFLRDHADGSPLFPAGAFSSPAALARRAAKASDWSGDRAALAAFLAAQCPDQTGLRPAQRDNLAAAARSDALFVLTGQQPGLLGGPALGLHKAMTAVAWARESSKTLGRPVIPVFWVAGDDSDLAESNAAEFLEPQGSTTAGADTASGLLRAATSVTLEFPDADEAVPMSLRRITAEHQRALLESLPASWSASARALAARCYAPGRSLTEAFAALMNALLGDEGLLFVDGLAVAGRPEAQAVLRSVTEEPGRFHEALLRGTARLRETLGLPPQVPVRAGTVPVFLYEHERRSRLFASDSGRVYVAGDEGHDLRSALKTKTLLHSALSRALVVDTVFPVLGHVLGPAELRYFAQIADVFPAFGCGFPVLAPRQQAMVVPQAGLRALESLGFRAEDLADLRPSKVRTHLTEHAWRGHPAAAAFPDADYQRFRDALAAYEAQYFPRASQSGGGRFDAARRRLDRAFGHYRDAGRASVFASSAAERFQSLQPLLRWLAGGSQDRHLNVLSLWNALHGADDSTPGSAGQVAYLAAIRQTGDTVSAYGLTPDFDALFDDAKGAVP